MSSQLHTYPIPLGEANDGSISLPVLFVPVVPDDSWDEELVHWPTNIRNSDFEVQLYDRNRRPIGEPLVQGDGFSRNNSAYQADIWPSVFDPRRVRFMREDSSTPAEIRSFSAHELSEAQFNLAIASALELQAEGASPIDLSVLNLSATQGAAIRDHRDLFASLQRGEERAAHLRPSDVITFHNTLHACVDDLRLSRAIGIAEEFSIPWSLEFPAEGYIFVYSTSGPFLGRRFSSSAIAYLVEDDGGSLQLFPRHEDPHRKRGLNQVRSGSDAQHPFTFAIHDLDGTRFKQDNAPSDQDKNRVLDKDLERGPAGFRSEGITVFSNTSRDELIRSFATSQAQEQNAEAYLAGLDDLQNSVSPTPASWLNGDDLTQGYRFDVDLDGTAYSLYGRRVEYSATNRLQSFASLLIEDGEGYSEPTMTTTADSSESNQEHQSHPSIAVWDGWSLAVPKPQITEKRNQLENEEPFFRNISLPRERRIDSEGNWVEEIAPRLPRLTYGDIYVFSARLVYFGNIGLTLAQAQNQRSRLGGEFQSQEIRFCRAESIPSPLVVFDSGDGKRHQDAQTAFNALQNRTSRVDVEVNDSVEAPSKSEIYVTLDNPKKRRRSRWIYPPEAGLPIVEFSAKLRDFSYATQFDLLKKRIPGKKPSYERSSINYLPDPWALSAKVEIDLLTRDRTRTYEKDDGSDRRESLVNLENGTWRREVPFYGSNQTWPDARPFRLEVIATNRPLSYVVADPAPDSGDRIRIYVADGDRIRITVSTKTSEENARNFLLTQMLENVPTRIRRIRNDEVISKLVDEAVASMRDHPMVAPVSVLSAVHPVREPKQAPNVSNPTVSQDPGSDVASFIDTLSVDGASISEVFVRSEWSEIEDDVSQEGPRKIERSVTSSSLALDASQLTVMVPNDTIELITSTRAKTLATQVVGVSRFGEYFSEPSASIASDHFDLEIKNTATPDPVHIAYAVPVFDWQRGKKDRRSLQSRRHGQLFRIYINRPWCLTGDEEMLGVVCWPDAFGDLPSEFRNAIRPFVSQWGRDPLLTTRDLEDGPFTHHFLDADAKDHGLVLPEFQSGDLNTEIDLSTRRVAVAGYIPKYDVEKKLWFVDVRVRTQDAYLPWIRLALARWQPNAIQGAELSPTTPTMHFTQLQPDRIASITRHAMDSNTISVRVSGPSGHGDESQSLGTPRMSVSVQHRKYARSEVWEEVSGSTVLLARSNDLGRGGAWSGALRVSSNQIGSDYRLVIRETLAAPSDSVHLHQENAPVQSRTVYIEHVPMSMVFSAQAPRKRRVS